MSISTSADEKMSGFVFVVVSGDCVIGVVLVFGLVDDTFNVFSLFICCEKARIFEGLFKSLNLLRMVSADIFEGSVITLDG